MADDVKRPEIDSPEALEAWLKDKPTEWAQAIAVRAALRVFPLVFRILEAQDQRSDVAQKHRLILLAFRAGFVSRAAHQHPTSELRPSAKAAASAARAAIAIWFDTSARAADSAAKAADAAARAAVVVAGSAATATSTARVASAVARAAASASAADFVVRGTAGAGGAEIWRDVSEDCRWLLGRGRNDDLIDEPLRLSKPRRVSFHDERFTPLIQSSLYQFSQRQEVKNGPWWLIVGWYKSIIPESYGEKPRSLFGETADIAIATQPDEFWTVTEDRSAEDVLRDIERIRDGKPLVFTAAASADENDTVSGPPSDEDSVSADSDVLWTDAVPTHSDEPTGDDHLGRRPFARALVERMIEVKHASGRDGFAIHLHAPWGAGKTFILRMMDAMLRQPEQDGKPWVVVHFNAWEHERRKPPWWPMIEALKDGCVACLDTSHHWLKAEAVKRLWRTWILLAEGPPYVLGVFAFALLVSVAAWGGGELIKLGTAVFTIFMALLSAVVLLSRRIYFGSADGSKLYFDLSRDPMKKISELFREIVDTADEPICIFIDDLDRCNADYVVDLLEGIQTSFRHRNVTYVVAADRAWIRASFEQRYSNFSSHVGNPGQPLGYLFLEKIFQVSTPVPGMGGVKQNYWKHLLAGEAETRKADTDEVAESWVSKAGDRYQKKSVLPTAIFDEKVRVKREEIRDEFGGELSEADVRILLSRASTETDRVATILNYSESEGTTREAEHLLLKFSEFLPDNPRVMKRMVNSYKFRRVIGYLESNSVGHEVLARWTILEQRFPALADLLIEHPGWADMLAEGDVKVIDMPQALQPFAGDKDVMKVLGAPEDEHPLREGDIEKITRGSAT